MVWPRLKTTALWATPHFHPTVPSSWWSISFLIQNFSTAATPAPLWPIRLHPPSWLQFSLFPSAPGPALGSACQVAGVLLWPACTDSYFQGLRRKLKIDQTMWQFSAAIFSSMNRMFSIIFFLFVQYCKWEIIWLECWLMLFTSLHLQQAVQRVGGWKGWQVFGYGHTQGLIRLGSKWATCRWMVLLEAPLFHGSFVMPFAWQLSRSGLAPPHWEGAGKEDWGCLRLGHILSWTFPTEQL